MKKRNKPRPRNLPSEAKENQNEDRDDRPQQIPAEVLEKLPEETRVAVIQAASFSGPLPPPALFGGYEDVLPGSAERILRMTELEQAQRHGWDNKAVNIQGGEIKRGQWLGFAIGFMAIAGAVICAFLGQQVIAVALVGTSAAGIVTAFIKGRSEKE